MGRVTFRSQGRQNWKKKTRYSFHRISNLGAKFEYDSDTNFYKAHAPNGLKGNYMLLDEASVTGTANIIMAAVLAEGETTIYNAACEPIFNNFQKC